MTRLADPRRCPSCRSPLPPETLVCPGCHLDLRGEPGMRLFALLTEADGLIAQMRAQVLAPAADPRPAGPVVPTPGPVAPAPGGAAPPGARIGLATVPKVLLGLGALCVLVAASLFLPFAWSLLGVLGRTLVLVALTVAAGAAAGVAARRGLRATSESLGVVMLGLLAFDLSGARASGWLGEPSGAAFAVLLGAVLLGAGTGATLWLRRTPVATFVGGEVVATLAGVLVLLGTLDLDVGTAAQRLVVVVPVLAVLALGAHRLRSPGAGAGSMVVTTFGLTAVAVTAWAALFLTGVTQLGEGLSWAAMWPGGAGLTLTLAGGYAVAVAVARQAPVTARVAALSVALLPWTLALTAPGYDEQATARALVVLAPLGCCLAVSLVAPRRWRAALAPTGLLSALAATALVTPLAVSALSTYLETAVPVWQGTTGARAVPTWETGGLGSPWLLPLVTVVLTLTVLVAARELERGDRSGSPTTLLGLGAGLTVLATTGALLLEAAPVWLALTVLAVATCAAGAAAARTTRTDLHVVQLALAGAALGLSLHDEWLTLATSALLLGLALLHHLRGGATVRVLAGVVVGPLLTLALWSGGSLLDTEVPWRTLVVLLVLGATVITRGLAGDGAGSLGVELGAAAAAATVTWVSVLESAPGSTAPWLAVHLTVAGVAVCALALIRPDRRGAGWAGGLLLVAASWVRLGDLGVSAPEAYTLPSALVLLVLGLRRTGREPTVGTVAAWSPGLGLALVPSLLWALADPLSWRALALGACCLLLAVVGAQLRLAAPFLWGAGVGGTLVLWEVLPPAMEMSAWLVIGVAGAGLLVLGASWEQRVRDARSALGYVRALR